jgi:hypothetical protein
MPEKAHPDYERWVREGRKRGPFVRTTSRYNDHHLPPRMDLDLVRIHTDGKATISVRCREGILNPGEWEWIKKEAGA